MLPAPNFWSLIGRLRPQRRAVLIALVLLAVALLPTIANAQGPLEASNTVGDDEVNVIAKKLYCPICENTPLDVCPTQACKDWRALIRQQLSQGWTEPQILDYFVARFGLQVLAEPPPRGFSTLVWILPVFVLAGGGIFLWQLLRRWQLSPQAAAASAVRTGDAPSGISPDMLARIEREVERRY